MQITVRYSAIDGAKIKRSFKTLKGANRFAAEYVGDHPSIGSGYAVSDDGVGKVTVSGCSLRELFNGFDAAKPLPASESYRSPAERAAEEARLARIVPADIEDRPYRIAGCTCCDQQLYLVGCECPAENPGLPF